MTQLSKSKKEPFGSFGVHESKLSESIRSHGLLHTIKPKHSSGRVDLKGGRTEPIHGVTMAVAARPLLPNHLFPRVTAEAQTLEKVRVHRQTPNVGGSSGGSGLGPGPGPRDWAGGLIGGLGGGVLGHVRGGTCGRSGGRRRRRRGRGRWESAEVEV